MAERSAYDPGQFCWVDLSSRDMATAREFYRNVFGWTCRDEDTQGGPPYASFCLDGRVVGGLGQLSEEMQARGVPPTWNNYVRVENAEATVKRAVELGGSVTVPCMKVMEAGSLAFLQDPAGASFAIWQPDRHFGAELVNQHATLCWNELATTDVGRAREFYGELFGWGFHEIPEMQSYSVIRNRETDNGGILQMTAEWQGIPPHWMVYFATDDVDATAAEIQKHDGRICVPPTDIPPGRFAVANDPHGATFSLIKLTQSA